MGNRVGQGWLESLYDQFDTSGYPAMYSDIAALMVLEHQARMTNLITRLGREAEIAGGVNANVQKTVDELADYMLFVDEPTLPSLVVSTSGYPSRFTEGGSRDSKGRSLRELDLKTRLFRYPCSYMIYSAAFDALPLNARQAVYRRMWQILSGADKGEKYARLPSADRKAIIEILRDTKEEFTQLGGLS